MKLEDIDNVLSEITYTQRSSLQDAEVVKGRGNYSNDYNLNIKKESRKDSGTFSGYS